MERSVLSVQLGVPVMPVDEVMAVVKGKRGTGMGSNVLIRIDLV